MNNCLLLLILIISFGLCGCSGTGALMNLDGTAIVQSATDRHSVWGAVESKKVDAVIAIADAEKEKALAEKAKADASAQNTVITVNTDASMAMYQLGEANKRIADMGTLMGEALIAEKTGKTTYTAGLNFTELPEGAFSETIHAVGDAAGEVLNTPVALAVGTGVVMKHAIEAAGDTMTFNGDTKITDSMNTSESHVTGSTSTSVSQTPKTVEPSVTVVDQPEPVIVTGEGD